MMAFILGLIIGSILGLTGAGGSVFAVPLLILIMHLPVPDAIGIAMGAVAASAIYGSINNWRSRSILWVQASLLGISGVLFAPAGRWLGTHVDETVLLFGFSLLAISIAGRMFWQSRVSPEASRVLRSSNLSVEAPRESICRLSPSGHFQWGSRCVGILLLSGSFIGLLTGLFGVGGGFIIVPLLIHLNRLSIHQAIATSLVIIAAVSSSGFASYVVASPAIDYSLLGFIALGGIAGMFIGQVVGAKIAGPLLQQAFAVCLAAIAIVTLLIN